MTERPSCIGCCDMTYNKTLYRRTGNGTSTSHHVCVSSDENLRTNPKFPDQIKYLNLF